MAKIPALTVTLEDIPPAGLELGLEVTPEMFAQMAAAGVEPPALLSPLTGVLRLSLTGGRRLRVKGSFRARVLLPCDRCLNEAPAELAGEVNEALELGGAGDLEDEDLDGRLPVIDGRVELAPLLVELFWLAHPYRFICRPDCAGLCPRCGADLNGGPCDCRM